MEGQFLTVRSLDCMNSNYKQIIHDGSPIQQKNGL